MKCPKCGAPAAESDKFCRTCGAEIPRTEENEVPPIDSTIYGVPPGGSFGAPPFGAPPFGGSAGYFTPMRWYKFLIYFALFAGAVLNTFSAFTYLAGMAYVDELGNNVTSLQYEAYPLLQLIDIVYGILLLGVAAFGIYTRFALALYKKSGPMTLFVFYGVSAGISLLREIACAILVGNIGDPLTIASFAITVLANVILIVLNNIYFEKRSHLFVN